MAKVIFSDEQRRLLENFLDQALPKILIISQNIGGQLQIHTDWPTPLRNKGVFFVKRWERPIPENVTELELLNHMTCGDIHPNSLEHFCALVEEVMVPLLRNELNLAKFPQCIADDIRKQIHELATSVYQIRGHIKGKTLLPFPQGAAALEEQESRARASQGVDCDSSLKNAIEGIIIKWAYQVQGRRDFHWMLAG